MKRLISISILFFTFTLNAQKEKFSIELGTSAYAATSIELIDAPFTARLFLDERFTYINSYYDLNKRFSVLAGLHLKYAPHSTGKYKPGTSIQISRKYVPKPVIGINFKSIKHSKFQLSQRLNIEIPLQSKINRKGLIGDSFLFSGNYPRNGQRWTRTSYRSNDNYEVIKQNNPIILYLENQFIFKNAIANRIDLSFALGISYRYIDTKQTDYHNEFEDSSKKNPYNGGLGVSLMYNLQNLSKSKNP